MNINYKWNREAIYYLLRYGRKCDGMWNDESIWPEDDSLVMPYDDDADLVAAAPMLYKALEGLMRIMEEGDTLSKLAWANAVLDAYEALEAARGEDRA